MRQILIPLFFFLTISGIAQKKPGKTLPALASSPFKTQITPLSERNCYTVEYEKYLQSKNPNRQNSEDFEIALAEQIQLRASMRGQAEEVYRIPVIVHVIHDGEPVGSGSNISQAQIQSQIDILNEDFRRLGGGLNDDPRGADILVEFYLALTDTLGEVLPEAGINRINGEQAFWEVGQINTVLKPATYWNPERYFNVWVVNFGGQSSDLLGFAQFPSLSGLTGINEDGGLAETDGVVVKHQAFGTGGSTQAPFNGGRTMTHEVGHWLGLRHIWGDGDCSEDDFCADTPNAAAPNSGCPTGTDSCIDPEGPDMIENYMDYTHDACMNIFTQDQKTRMRTVLEVSPRRNTLITLSGCYDASFVSSGANTAVDENWYKISATQDTVITVSSVGSTTLDTRALFALDDCDNGIFFESEDELGTQQSQFSTLLFEGQTLLFSWRNKTDDTDIDWVLTQSTLEIGKSSILADTMVLGTNSIPGNNIDIFWATYFVTASDQAVTINNSLEYQLYVGTYDDLEKVYSGNGSHTLTSLQQGEQVFIRLQTQGQPSTIDISQSALQPGQGCSTALEALEGTNSHATTPHWYSFAMPIFGDLKISSVGQTMEDTYLQVYTACEGDLLGENDDFEGTLQSELLLESLDAGQEIRIVWSDLNGSAGFDWTLEVFEPTPGTECEVPVEAQIGANTSIFEAGSDLSWFSFVMPEADKKLSISSQTSEIVAILSGDCENFDIISSGEGSAFAVELLQNEPVYIVWVMEGGGDIMWNLAIEEIEPGEICSNPINAIAGTNSATQAPQWFSYTVEVDGIVTISSAGSGVDTYLEVYNECSGALLAVNDDIDFPNNIYQSKVVLTDLTQGSNLLINWLPEWSSDGFSWELENRAATEGEECDLAAGAELGINEVPQAPYWFTYTVPIDGDVVITNDGLTSVDSDVAVYDNCGGILLDANDDIDSNTDNFQSEVVLTEVPGGTTLYIRWMPTWSFDGFSWELRLENTGNSAPEMEDQGFIISEPFENGTAVGTVLATDIDQDDLSFNLTDDHSGAFNINALTGEITIVDGTLVSLDTETLIVEVTDGIFKSAATITIDKTLLNRSPEIEDQLFTLQLPATSDQEVGIVIASDFNEDELTFSITSGNDNGAYSIDAMTGQLTIGNTDQISEEIDVITVTVSDGELSATAEVTIEKIAAPLGVDDEKLIIYPNPSNGIIFLSAKEPILELKIFSLEGKQQAITLEGDKVNIQHLQSGIYVVQIETASRTSFETLVLR